jgi:hypothetical protein
LDVTAEAVERLLPHDIGVVDHGIPESRARPDCQPALDRIVASHG